MKKFWIQFIVLLVIILGSLYLVYHIDILSGYVPQNTSQIRYAQRNIIVGTTTVRVEIADTADKRRVGLSGKAEMPADQGMLFIFPEEKQYQFWMKGVLLPLDFIFIKDGRVVDLMKNIPIPNQGQKDSDLPIYEPITSVDMLLEVNSGFITQNNIKVADVVSLIE